MLLATPAQGKRHIFTLTILKLHITGKPSITSYVKRPINNKQKNKILDWKAERKRKKAGY